MPAGVEQLFGNRDPEKTADDRKTEGKADAKKDPLSPRGLSQLAGKKWDSVIDTSGYFPRMVKASAELLAPNVGQYVFISTISVYKDMSVPGFDESALLQTLSDPTTEEMGKDFENYGGGKALCEKAASDAMPGRATLIRPGYIVGPDDPRRFTDSGIEIEPVQEARVPQPQRSEDPSAREAREPLRIRRLEVHGDAIGQLHGALNLGMIGAGHDLQMEISAVAFLVAENLGGIEELVLCAPATARDA